MQYITERQQPLSVLFQYLKGGYKEDEKSIFHVEQTRGNGYKLLLETLWLQTREKFLQCEQSDIGMICPGKW